MNYLHRISIYVIELDIPHTVNYIRVTFKIKDNLVLFKKFHYVQKG